MAKPLLTLQGVAKAFTQGGNRIAVLDRIDLQLGHGESMAMVGPSGSGKSTLLHIAGLLERPDAGSIQFHDAPLEAASDNVRTLHRRREMGFVYQHHHLLPDFTALENVMMPLLIGGARKGKAKAAAKEWLDKLGLKERMKHRPAALSGGEQQRVAIARALVHEPSMLLADEPTGNLDPHTAELVFTMLLKLVKEQKLAVLMATHNLDLAKRMDRVVEINNTHLLERRSASS